jgi:hypothetical protein
VQTGRHLLTARLTGFDRFCCKTLCCAAYAQFRRATDPQFVPSPSVSEALARAAPSLRKSSSLSSCVSRSGRGSCWSHRYNSRSSSAIASRIAARSSLLLGVGLRTTCPGNFLWRRLASRSRSCASLKKNPGYASQKTRPTLNRAGERRSADAGEPKRASRAF